MLLAVTYSHLNVLNRCDTLSILYSGNLWSFLLRCGTKWLKERNKRLLIIYTPYSVFLDQLLEYVFFKPSIYKTSLLKSLFSFWCTCFRQWEGSDWPLLSLSLSLSLSLPFFLSHDPSIIGSLTIMPNF